MFYYLYQIKNNLDGKIYVGVHQTNNLNDGYMGSGKVIRSAIHKHGVENFTKVILEYFENTETMYAKEAKIVNLDFLKRSDVYNLCCGGSGGWEYLNKDSNLQRSKGARGNAKMKFLRKTNKEWSNKNSMIHSKAQLKTYIEGRGVAGCFGEFQSEMVKRAAQPKAIEKRKETFKSIGHQQGEKNSSFGSMWITNEIENKKIKKTNSIPEGWRKGRKIMNAPVHLENNAPISPSLAQW